MVALFVVTQEATPDMPSSMCASCGTATCACQLTVADGLSLSGLGTIEQPWVLASEGVQLSSPDGSIIIGGTQVAPTVQVNCDAVKACETTTTLVHGVAPLTLEYVDEDGGVSVIDFGPDVAELETLTTLERTGPLELTYTDEDGVATVIDLCADVADCETTTTLVATGPNQWEYTNEDGVATTIAVAAGVPGLQWVGPTDDDPNTPLSLQATLDGVPSGTPLPATFLEDLAQTPCAIIQGATAGPATALELGDKVPVVDASGACQVRDLIRPVLAPAANVCDPLVIGTGVTVVVQSSLYPAGIQISISQLAALLAQCTVIQ